MAQIKAFQAYRPRKELTSRIAALPYDVYNRREAKVEVEKEPYSFLKIDRAETQFADDTDIYAPEVYQKAHDLLWEMIEHGEFQKDAQESFYVYELTMKGRKQTGLVALASVDDYLNGVIMKHENTRVDKELDRIRHVDICNAQTGPIFLAYRKNETIKNIIAVAKQKEPIFDFTAPDGISHRGWMISLPEDVAEIQKEFSEISKIYIADGHHRAASAVKVSLKRRAEAMKRGEQSDSEHEYDSFLSVLFADEELYIMDYNRVVRDLNGETPESFLEKISGVCDIEKIDGHAEYHPLAKRNAGMYLAGNWYHLTFKQEFLSDDPVEGLDVSILQNEILSPVLGIQNPKIDERISFVGGIRGLKELENMVDECSGVAFSMYPTSMNELFAVADAGRLMPPKSTWFEPKLRSGLFIHSLDEVLV